MPGLPPGRATQGALPPPLLTPTPTPDNTSPSVILVGVDFGAPHFDGGLEELGLLAQTAGYRVADRVACKRRAPDPALFVGSGKADEIKLLAQSTGASEVLLSPTAHREAETAKAHRG